MKLLSRDRLVVLIEHLLEEEVSNTPDEALGSLLRGNNALSKLEVELARSAGHVWLLNTYVFARCFYFLLTLFLFFFEKRLGPILERTCKDVAFHEVDPTRMPAGLAPPQTASTIELGKGAVLALAQDVLDAACSQESLASLPDCMQRVVRKTFECARERGAEDPLAVAGGFLWLRVLSPSLTTPATAGLTPRNVLLHANTRRRLLLVTKVLQGASNNVPFGNKEPHMLQFNPFIAKASKIIRDFIQCICKGPQTKKRDTTEDASGAEEETDHLYSDITELESVSPDTLLSLHRLCALFNDKWMASLSKKGLLGKSGTRLVKILGQVSEPMLVWFCSLQSSC